MSSQQNSNYSSEAEEGGAGQSDSNFELDLELLQNVLSGNLAINDYFSMRPAGPEESEDDFHTESDNNSNNDDNWADQDSNNENDAGETVEELDLDGDGLANVEEIRRRIPQLLNPSMVESLNKTLEINIKSKMDIQFNCKIPKNHLYNPMDDEDDDFDDDFDHEDDEDEDEDEDGDNDSTGFSREDFNALFPHFQNISQGSSFEGEDLPNRDGPPFWHTLRTGNNATTSNGPIFTTNFNNNNDNNENNSAENGNHHHSSDNIENENENSESEGSVHMFDEHGNRIRFDRETLAINEVQDGQSGWTTTDEDDSDGEPSGPFRARLESPGWEESTNEDSEIDIDMDTDMDSELEGDDDEDEDDGGFDFNDNGLTVINQFFISGATNTRHPERPFFIQSSNPEVRDAIYPKRFQFPCLSNHSQCANSIAILKKPKALSETIATISAKFLLIKDIGLKNLIPDTKNRGENLNALIQLNYRPYTITSGYGYLISCGERGLTIIHLKSMRPVLVRDYKNIREVDMVNSVDIRRIPGGKFGKVYPHPKTMQNQEGSENNTQSNDDNETTDLLICFADNDEAIEVWGIFETDVSNWTVPDGPFIDHDLCTENLKSPNSIFHSHPRKYLVPVAYFNHLNGIDFPVNCVKFSPNGKWMAIVGDTPFVHLIPIKPEFGDLIKIQVPIPQNQESENSTAADFTSQYLAWNSNGRLFAFTSDSHPYVWVVDITSQKVIYTIPTSIPSLSITFHPTIPSLLAIGHRGTYFHIVKFQINNLLIEKSTYTHTLYKLPITASIEGISWSSHGRSLYIATFQNLFIYDLTQLPTLTEICVDTLKRKYKEEGELDLLSILPKQLKNYF